MVSQLKLDKSPKVGLQWPAFVGALMSLVFLFTSVAWAHMTVINGAVIASGSVIVRGKPKAIQHLDGGIVDKIYVQDGDFVKKGQPLVLLDDTLLSANMDIYKTRLTNALALRDRLEAEQVGDKTIEFDDVPQILEGVDQSVARKGQSAIFKSRVEVQNGRHEQLLEKNKQFQNQIDGTTLIIESKQEQLSYVNTELEMMLKLAEKRLARESQLLAIKRQRADLSGQIAEHHSEIARVENSIRDTKLEMLLAVMQVREEAVTSLRDVNTDIGELTQQIVSTQKQLDRIVIQSPVDGIVHEMQVVTLGGVVPPGGTILNVIPRNDGVVFETRVDPIAIDQVFLGQNAKVMMAAFNQRTTPELTGQVVGQSPDIVVDEATGQPFYRINIGVSDEEIAKLNGLEIIPGMPVEAFLQTDERTVLSYLTKPLTDHVNKAFREE